MEVLNFGCTANLKEAQLAKLKLKELQKYLLEKGYIEELKKLNDLVYINSCAVKGPTEAKILNLAKKLKNEGKLVIVGGCLSLAYKEKLKKEGIKGIGENFLDINDLLNTILNYDSFNNTLIKNNKEFKDDKNRLVLTGNKQEIIEINRGCLGNCTFCATKLAIPGFYSYKSEDIVKLIEEAYKRGVKEIFLTSQDTGAYGLDNKENLLELVRKINNWWNSLENKREDFFIRIGMMNPNFLSKIIDELLEEMEKGPFYKFIHLPIQSASNKILNFMNRGYTKEEWLELAKKIKNKQFTLATDIIVAYPGESNEDFEETLKILDKVELDIINISRFWPREGTKAADEYKLNKIPESISKNRAKILKEHFENKLNLINSKLVGKRIKALINEIDYKRKSLKGKDKYYRQIIIPFEEIIKAHNLSEDKEDFFKILDNYLWKVLSLKVMNCNNNNLICSLDK